MSEKKKSEFGIWKKQVRLKDGTTTEVLSFSVNGTRYSAWSNRYKQNEKSPDYNVYIDNYVKPDAGQVTNVPATSSNQASMQAPDTSNDGLPF